MEPSNAAFPIFKLPVELLIKVFRHVDLLQPLSVARQVRLVCKPWHEIVTTTPALWQDIVFCYTEDPTRTKCTTMEYVELVKTYLKYSKGDIRGFVTDLGTAIFPMSQDPKFVSAVDLVPWNKLQTVCIHGVPTPFLQEKIRSCAALKCLSMSTGHALMRVQPTDPLAKERIDKISLKFDLTLPNYEHIPGDAHVLSQTRARKVHLTFVTARSWQIFDLDLLKDTLHDLVIERFYESLTLSLIVKYAHFASHSCEVVITRPHTPSPNLEAKESSDEVALTVKHDRASLLVLQIPEALLGQRIVTLIFHDLAEDTTTLLSSRDWVDLRHVVIENCRCAFPKLTSLREVKNLLAVLSRSTPPNLHGVELRDFGEWSCSGSLDHIKDKVKNA